MTDTTSPAGGTEVRLLIDGARTPSADSVYYPSYSPNTGEVTAMVAASTGHDVDLAVAAARRAFDGWHRTSFVERRRVLLAAADVLESRATEIRHTMAVETGAVAGWAAMNTAEAAATLREAAALTSSATGEVLPSHEGESTNLSLRVAAGVVVAIVPWNAPLVLAARATAIALAVGNTVILRPSEHSPLSAGHILADALTSAGAPPGVVNVLTTSPGTGRHVVEALVAHPAVRRVVFIGSTPVGRQIAQFAGKHLKPAVMELGGKNATIVLDDADLDLAAATIMRAAFANSGQVCMATDRVIAGRATVDGLTHRIAALASRLQVGDPSLDDTDLGPLISLTAAENFRALVRDAVDKGASMLTGTGDTDGCFAAPVVLEALPTSARLSREEAFSPVVSIEAAVNETDAIHRANDSEFGLIASVLSSDPDHGWRVAEQLQVGAVHVNGPSNGDEPHVPFGGVGASGFGRLGGMESVRTFTEQRTLYLHGIRLGASIVKTGS